MKADTKLLENGRSARDYKLEAEAKRAWRDYCKKPDAVDYAFDWFNESYPGIVPEAFGTSGNERTRKAYDMLRGNVGRLRVLVGEPLELRRINYENVPELTGLTDDVFAQFEPGLVKLAFDALTRYVDGAMWGVTERGRVNGQNHFHMFSKPGSCSLGVSNGIVEDSKLLNELTYLCKTPEWQLENVVGGTAPTITSKRDPNYARVEELGGRLWASNERRGAQRSRSRSCCRCYAANSVPLRPPGSTGSMKVWSIPGKPTF